jgi:hypothetical protein
MSHVQRVERIGDGNYRVLIRTSKEERDFTFRVEVHEGIEVVTWPEEFDLFMENNTGSAQPLLAAVLAFHQAQHTPFPAP